MDSEKDWKDMFDSECRSSERKTFIKFLLDAVVDINALNKYGKTLLSYATECGNIEIVDFLVQKGAEGNVTNSDGSKPLHLAAKHGHPEIVKFFLSLGIFADCRNNHNDTPLHCVAAKRSIPKAARDSYQEVVHLLLNSKADLNAVNKEGLTPLLLAGRNQHKYLVELFIRLGADVHHCNENSKCTVLHYSCDNGWLRTVRSLVKGKFNISLDARNESGETPLIVAATSRHKDIVKLLIESGADVKMKDSQGCILLHFVCLEGWLDLVKYLVRMGCDVNTKSSNGDTPLFVAVESFHLSVVEYLVDSGADVNRCDNDSRTALHSACQEDLLDVVKYLIRKGCDLDAKDSDGDTPLMVAARWAGLGVVECLIESGAGIICCNENKETPLHLACVNKNTSTLDIVKALTKKGSQINSQERFHLYTPLHAAIRWHRFEIVKHLLEVGADCNVSNVYGFSAFHDFLASEIICLEGIVLFLEKGAYFDDDIPICDYPLTKEGILKDLNVCTLALMNKFNADLLNIYEIPGFSKCLPPVEQLKIISDTNVAQDIAQSVKNEIQSKGFCNILKVHPMNLAILSAESLVKYFCT